jgi:methylated-DNA-protein-cysteine methyltransferase-like protein
LERTLRPKKERKQASIDLVRAAERILDVVDGIPHGRVATYGQVARRAGLPRRARLVGMILGRLSDPSPVPWHRVVNAGGGISPRAVGQAEQRAMLEREGVAFGPNDRIDLGRFGCPDDGMG